MEKLEKINNSIAIVGSTASGKSALALMAAKKIGGEIISVDSMQVYKTMDIGTAKPTKEEMADVPHHMIDVCDPFLPFSAADFAPMALECARDIASRGKTPIFCGGTGLYLDCVMRGGAPAETAADEKIRAELLAFAEENGAHALHERLLAVDAESAEAIHENNVKRVARALEIFLVSGRKKSDWDRESLDIPKAIEPLVVGLAYHNREILYRRIDDRVEVMLSDGLLDETIALKNAGVFEKNSTAAAAIGYKEMLPYINGEMPLDEATEQLKTATRRYAKRQMTWFAGKPYVKKLYCDTEEGEMLDIGSIYAEFEKIIGEENAKQPK